MPIYLLISIKITYGKLGLLVNSTKAKLALAERSSMWYMCYGAPPQVSLVGGQFSQQQYYSNH